MKKVTLQVDAVIANFVPMQEWLLEIVGKPLPYEYEVYEKNKRLKKFYELDDYKWCKIVDLGNTDYYFKDNKHAMLFKLTWG
jgi:hypothetical protein